MAPPPGFDRALTFIDSWLAYRYRQLDLPGFAVAIRHGEDPPFSRAYGVADVERQEPLTAAHRMSIGSQSKMLTATALLQMAERGSLSLDDRVATYLPWLAGHTDVRFASVTLRQLLCHGGGVIRDGQNADYWQLAQPFPDSSTFQRAVLGADIVIDAYTKLKYSNVGYALLGQVLEAVSGKPYADHVAESVIVPAGIDAVLDSDMAHALLVARGYTRQIDRRRLAVPREVDSRAFAPSVGWYSTVNDMCRFVSGLLATSDGLLRLAAKQEMRRRRRGHWVPVHQRGSEYGLGMEIHRFGRRVLLGHSGSMTGYRSCTFGDPEDGLVVAVMVNAKDAPAMQILGGIFAAIDYFQEHVRHPAAPQGFADPMRFVGLASTIQLVAADERIIAIDPDRWFPFHEAEELIPLTDTTFRIDRASDMSFAGETATIVLDGAEATAITFGGTTMWREDAYLEWLADRTEVMAIRPPRSARADGTAQG